MAYITTDRDVACTITVRKTVNGQNLGGYPKQYSLLDAFEGFKEITVDEWHKTLEVPRLKRIKAFISYINHIEEINIEDKQTNEVFRPATVEPGIVVG